MTAGRFGPLARQSRVPDELSARPAGPAVKNAMKEALVHHLLDTGRAVAHVVEGVIFYLPHTLEARNREQLEARNREQEERREDVLRSVVSKIETTSARELEAELEDRLGVSVERLVEERAHKPDERIIGRR